MSLTLHSRACACCGDLLAGRFDRRAFLKATGGAGLLAAFPFAAFGASGSYDAMFAVVLTVALLGFIADRLYLLLAHRMLRWQL